MVDFLIECGNRSLRPGIVQSMMHSTNAKYDADQQIMMELVDDSKSLFILYAV